MLKPLTTGILALALTMPSSGQGLKGPMSEDTLSNPGQISQSDSTSSTNESLPPLSLASPYRDSLELMFTNPEVTSRFNSWMSIPAAGNRIPLPSDLFLGRPTSMTEERQAIPLQSDLWLLESKSNLLAPLRLELKSQEKYRIWRTVLGSVQIGGMAYLLYLHFKKYGLK